MNLKSPGLGGPDSEKALMVAEIRGPETDGSDNAVLLVYLKPEKLMKLADCLRRFRSAAAMSRKRHPVRRLSY